MLEYVYSAWLDSGIDYFMCAANNMDLETATVLVDALFNKYYQEPSMEIKIKRKEKGDNQNDT